MADNEELNKIEETTFTVNDIDAVIDSLDLEELTERYATDVPAEASGQSEDGLPEVDPEPADSHEEWHTVSIAPANTGKSKRLFLPATGILLSLIIAVCAMSIVKNYRFAASAAAESTLAAPQPPQLTPVLPDSLALLDTDRQGIVYPEGMLEKYRPLYALNPEVVGWLKIPNTSIDTLITQRNNNDYYLENDFYKRHTLYGNSYLDFRNNPKELNQNNVIYGHSTMTKSQAFYDLYKYMDYSFYVNNPIIEYGTLYENHLWKVFAIYSISVNKKDDNGYMFYPLHPEIETEKFPGYLDQIMQRSRFYTDIGIDDNDKILTLCTCFYDNNYPGRYVDSRMMLAARLVREGESTEIDVSKVTDNPDYRRPQIWYNHYKIKNPYAERENWVQ